MRVLRCPAAWLLHGGFFISGVCASMYRLGTCQGLTGRLPGYYGLGMRFTCMLVH